MIEGKLKEIRCINIKESGYKCNRWMGDFPADRVHEAHLNCPNCPGVEWHVKQDANGVLSFLRVPKDAEKDYDDDGFRIEEATHAAG